MINLGREQKLIIITQVAEHKQICLQIGQEAAGGTSHLLCQLATGPTEDVYVVIFLTFIMLISCRRHRGWIACVVIFLGNQNLF